MNNVATPEDIRSILGVVSKDDRKEQDRLLAVYRSRARLNQTERQVARGIELERVYRASGNRDGLSEALAMQGRFSEAAAAAEDPERAIVCIERFNAMTRPDNDCACDNFKEVNGHMLPTQYVESYGHSAKHGGRMPFIRCTECGTLNARALPQHLADQHAIRNDPTIPDKERLNFFKV